MNDIGRRGFLVRTGLALSAALLTGACSRASADPPSPQSTSFTNWDDLRAQFPLSPQLIHLAAFFLASHPTTVREAIERHRAGLDADPIGYWYEHEEKQEAKVLQAAADYLGVEPIDIALTDSTTGWGTVSCYGGLQLRSGQQIFDDDPRPLFNGNLSSPSCRTNRSQDSSDSPLSCTQDHLPRRDHRFPAQRHFAHHSHRGRYLGPLGPPGSNYRSRKWPKRSRPSIGRGTSTIESFSVWMEFTRWGSKTSASANSAAIF